MKKKYVPPTPEEILASNRKNELYQFKSMVDLGKNIPEAYLEAANMINECGLKSLVRKVDTTGYERASAHTCLNVDFRKGTVAVELMVNFKSDFRDAVVHPDTKERLYPARAVVSVCFFSGNHSVAKAVACMALYREVVDLAAEIESVLSGYDLYTKEIS